MPKIMGIGKLGTLSSKTRKRARKAGSFRGALGAVVLEGSPEKSVRYGTRGLSSPTKFHKTSLKRMREAAESANENARKHSGRTGCDAALNALAFTIASVIEAEHSGKANPAAEASRVYAARDLVFKKCRCSG